MKLSIVTSLYGSEATVDAFHERMTRAADGVAAQAEFVYVNDGSPDRSLERVLALRDRDARIVVVDLARNFGHHPALMTGIEAATGDFIFLIDSDLEEPPELLPAFWTALREDARAGAGADSVYGVQVRRKGALAERLLGAIWYKLFCRLTSLPYPADSLTARLMTRRFADAVLLHKERALDLMGIFALTGYRQVAIPATKTSKGGSSYTLGKRVGIAATGLTSFTTAPLTVIAAIGCFITAIAAVAGLALLLLALAGAVDFSLAGFAIWSIWFLGGLLLAAIGTVGLYGGTILQETKARPRSIVRTVYRAEDF
jgi:putative glycosyltransferase